MAHFVGALEELPRECDDFGYDKFGYGPGVGEGRIENWNASFGGRKEVDLIRAYTEASDDQKLP
jgi:hypothetical protein